MDNTLEKLNNKISYVYELGNELYVIGRSKVFDLKYTNVTYPDYVKFFNAYKENINSSREELDKNNIGTFMYILSEFAYSEITSEANEEQIISTEDFWNNLNDDEKRSIEKQINDLSNVFYATDVIKQHPDIREN